MTRGILFVDCGNPPLLPNQHNYEITKIRVDLGCIVDTVESIETAQELLNQRGYGVVVVEPFIPEYLCKETQSPAIGFIRGIKQRGIPVVVATSYLENNFDECFGLRNGVDYDLFFAKPFIRDSETEQFCEQVKRLYQRKEE